MFCMNCGKEMPNDSKFCINCGAPVDTAEPAPPVQDQLSVPQPPQEPQPVIQATAQQLQPQPQPQPQPQAQPQPQPQLQTQAQPQSVQFAAAAPNPNYSLPYGPAASGMAPAYMGMGPDFTAEEISLINKGWTFCKAAAIMPIGYGILHGFFNFPDITRILSIVVAILLCIDKSYLSRVGIFMSAWYYLAIFACPPIYLYHREKLTGHGHALSLIYGALFAIGVLIIAVAIAKIS